MFLKFVSCKFHKSKAIKVVQPSLLDHSGVVASFNDLIVRNILNPSAKECLYRQVTVLNPYTFANFRDKLK